MWHNFLSSNDNMYLTDTINYVLRFPVKIYDKSIIYFNIPAVGALSSDPLLKPWNTVCGS